MLVVINHTYLLTCLKYLWYFLSNTHTHTHNTHIWLCMQTSLIFPGDWWSISSNIIYHSRSFRSFFCVYSFLHHNTHINSPWPIKRSIDLFFFSRLLLLLLLLLCFQTTFIQTQMNSIYVCLLLLPWCESEVNFFFRLYKYPNIST